MVDAAMAGAGLAACDDPVDACQVKALEQRAKRDNGAKFDQLVRSARAEIEDTLPTTATELAAAA